MHSVADLPYRWITLLTGHLRNSSQSLTAQRDIRPPQTYICLVL